MRCARPFLETLVGHHASGKPFTLTRTLSLFPTPTLTLLSTPTLTLFPNPSLILKYSQCSTLSLLPAIFLLASHLFLSLRVSPQLSSPPHPVLLFALSLTRPRRLVEARVACSRLQRAWARRTSLLSSRLLRKHEMARRHWAARVLQAAARMGRVRRSRALAMARSPKRAAPETREQPPAEPFEQIPSPTAREEADEVERGEEGGGSEAPQAICRSASPSISRPMPLERGEGEEGEEGRAPSLEATPPIWRIEPYPPSPPSHEVREGTEVSPVLSAESAAVSFEDPPAAEGRGREEEEPSEAEAPLLPKRPSSPPSRKAKHKFLPLVSAHLERMALVSSLHLFSCPPSNLPSSSPEPSILDSLSLVPSSLPSFVHVCSFLPSSLRSPLLSSPSYPPSRPPLLPLSSPPCCTYLPPPSPPRCTHTSCLHPRLLSPSFPNDASGVRLLCWRYSDWQDLLALQHVPSRS